MGTVSRPLAVVTGASTGIGYELARLCVDRGFNLPADEHASMARPGSAES